MKTVGLTGGIGSGKTTVASFFNKLGVPIYFADLEAKKLMKDSKILKRKLTQLFGKNAYVNDELNRSFLAEKIFNDKNLLHKMNTLVHPKVQAHFKKWLLKQNAPYVIKEVAIMFENDGYRDCDYVITVVASKEDRIKRVMQRDKSTRDKVIAVMNNQWTDEEKVKLSHFVISNDNLSQTEVQVAKTHTEILKQLSII